MARRNREVTTFGKLSKLKTVAQIAMVLALIAVHGKPLWVDLLVYATVVVTVLSAVDNFFNFHTLIRRREAAHARRSSHSRVET